MGGQRLAIRRRNEDIRASSESLAVLAERHALSASAVSRIRSVDPRTLTRRERFQLEVLEGGWRAACMDDDEWHMWVANNPGNVGVDTAFADRPCRDCPAHFAAEMRALDRCNGTPTGHEGEPADHSDEEADNVIDSRLGGVRGQPQPLALSMPPCESCVHEPVCVLKHALKKVTSIEAVAPALPDGLTVALSADVTCRFYNRQRGSGGSTTGRKLNLTDEERARRGRQALANTEARRAAREAAQG